MSPAVHTLRNRIRAEVDAQFTKEELAAFANQVGYAVDSGPLPSMSQMRAGIRWRVELSETGEAASEEPFTKDELEAIASHLDEKATREE